MEAQGVGTAGLLCFLVRMDNEEVMYLLLTC